MKRKIKPMACQRQPLDTADFATDPSGWFQEQTSVGDDAWFLAHADDGVIWGQIREGQLLTSDSVFPQVSPPLRAITLQQARLFGQSAQVQVWRGRDGFKACRLQDCQDDGAEAFDETHILWGTHVEAQAQGFTLVADGHQGLRHAVPLKVEDAAFGRGRPLRLVVRHYLTYDGDGQVRITLSRLVALRQVSEGGQDESQT